jgi:predicted RNA-binding protein with PIN domain
VLLAPDDVHPQVREEPRMALLIDGYNLLFAAGIVGPIRGKRGGESSRQALLDFVVDHLPEREVKRTTIVFDAADAPPGLPRQFSHRGIDVRFAPRNTSADALLEELIERSPDPRRLTVVSSDHRVQRAARQRGAKFVDSDQWHAELRRVAAQAAAAVEELKPDHALSPAEVDAWLREFGGPNGRRRENP